MLVNTEIGDLLSGKESGKTETHETYRFEPYEIEEIDIHEVGVKLGAEVTGEVRRLDSEDESLTYFMSFTY